MLPCSYVELKHLYIHWPFCLYKCHFCDFVAMAAHEQFMADYHQALLRELELFIPRAPALSALDTVYLGGGTPSTYPAPLLLDMFAILKRHFLISDQTEVTIEVNPGTVTPELLQAWHQAGINRLSIGVQSLKDAVLQSLNRHQTHQDVLAVLPQAARLFDNISVDFILGLPDVSEQDWKSMLLEAMTWPIKHISIYFLTVHEDTRLYFKVKTNKVTLPADDALVELYHWTVEFLQQHGFERYEISNFAKSGYQSRHNAAYWNRKPYAGFGLGACSFNGSVRYQNTKNLGKYLSLLTGATSVVDVIEYLTSQQIALEKIMLGLRQSKGLLIDEFMVTATAQEQQHFLSVAQQLQQAGLLKIENNKITLTPQGYVLENEVSLRLFSQH